MRVLVDGDNVVRWIQVSDHERMPPPMTPFQQGRGLPLTDWLPIPDICEAIAAALRQARANADGATVIYRTFSRYIVGEERVFRIARTPKRRDWLSVTVCHAVPVPMRQTPREERES